MMTGWGPNFSKSPARQAVPADFHSSAPVRIADRSTAEQGLLARTTMAIAAAASWQARSS
jgi:hypothetical protein